MFVGRDAERQVMADALDAARRGRPAILQVVGEPGIGKTRLLESFHASAAAAGFAVVASRGTEFDRKVPYGALTELVEELTDRRFAALSPADRAALTAVLDPDGDAEAVERYRRHRVVREALESASRVRGMVVSLDDAQWADGGSLDCWAHLVRRPPRGPLVLVLAHRTVPLPANLDASLADAHRAGAGRRLELGPLAFADADELIGRGRGPSWRRAVYEASGGNPLYLESLVKTAQPTAGAASLPPTIRAALRAELDVLDEATRVVAWAAAVAGDPFEPEMTAETGGLAEDAVLDALNALCRRDLVRPAGPRRFRFRHPLVRQVVYEAAAPGWRLAAHERALAALGRRGGPLAVRAYHVEQAARFGDRDAVDTLVAAAEQASTGSPATAAHWLRAALRLLPADGPARRLTVLLAEALVRAGRLDEGREVATRAVGEMRTGSAADRVPAVVLAATAGRLLGHHAAARELLTGELARLGPDDRREAVTLRLELAATSLMAGTFDTGGAALVDLLVREAVDLGDQPLIAAARGMAVMAAFLTGDEDAMSRCAAEAARAVDSLTDDVLTDRLDAVVWLSWGELHHQRWGEALRHLDRGLRLARGTGQVHLLTYLLAARACALRWQGHLNEALDCAEDAVEGAILSGSGELSAMAHSMRCWIALLVGDLDLATRSGAAAVAAGHDIGWWATIARLLDGMATLAADPSAEVSDAVLDAGGGPSLSRVDPFSKPLWYAFLTAAELAHERVDRAKRWADRIAAFASTFPVHRAVVLITAAHVADTPERALTLAEEAARAFDEAGTPLDAAESRLLAGTLLIRLGRRDDAVAALGGAADEFLACGARRLHAQAVAELRKLGRRLPSFEAARRRGRQGLTARELDVARLLATGRTNRQIADELVISLKTVETHVTHVLAKLGVPSRTAAAVALRDLD